jgi:hypothetical protein
MGTLEKDGSSKPLSFDGKASSWPSFKTALHKVLDKEGCSWVVVGGNAFCVMLQAAAAKAAKSKMASEKGTISTNVADYAKKDLQAAFASATVTTSDGPSTKVLPKHVTYLSPHIHPACDLNAHPQSNQCINRPQSQPDGVGNVGDCHLFL